MAPQMASGGKFEAHWQRLPLNYLTKLSPTGLRFIPSRHERLTNRHMAKLTIQNRENGIKYLYFEEMGLCVASKNLDKTF